MGYWGWRPFMLVFISAWITSCITSPAAIPPTAPTEYPPITLTVRDRTAIPQLSPQISPELTSATHFIVVSPEASPYVYIVQKGDTLRLISQRFDVDLNLLREVNAGIRDRDLYEGLRILIPDPKGLPTIAAALPQVAMDTPHCYPSSIDNVICFGLVHNTSGVDLGILGLTVRLWGTGDKLLGMANTQTAYHRVAENSSTPYYVLFTGIHADSFHATTSLQSVTRPPENAVMLDIVHADAQLIHTGTGLLRYHVEAEMMNNSPFTVASARAVMTVLDEDERIIGIRTFEIDGSFESGEAHSITLTVVLPSANEPSSHILHVEAEQR